MIDSSPRPDPQLSAAGPPAPGWWRVAPEGPGSTSVRGSVDERLRHWLWLVVCCLLLTAIAFVTRPGSIIADTKIDMAVDPASFLRRALELWDPAQFGFLQDQAVGYLFPMGPFYLLGKLLLLPAWAVQRLWLSALFVAAFLGAVRLGARFGIGTTGTRIAAGFGYALAPLGLGLMGVNSSEFAPAAFFPWILLPLVRLLRGGHEMRRPERLRPPAQSAAAVALCGGINAASVAAVLAGALIYVRTGQSGPGGTTPLNPPRRRWPGGTTPLDLPRATKSWSRWRVLAWWAPLVALASWWWAVPLLLLGKYGVSFLPYTESAQVTTSVTSLANVLRGTEDWTSYLVVNGTPWWPVAFHLGNYATPTVLTGLLAAAGIGGLLVRRIAEQRFLLWSLLVGLLIITSGYVGALGNPLATAIIHLINGPLAPARNLWKFDPLVRLPLALGIAQLLASWRFPRVRLAASGLAAVAIAGLAVPAAASGLSATGDFPAIPTYWVATANWLNQHADNQAVLAVPGARFGEYTWGRPMDDVLEALFSGNWASTQLSTIGSIGNARLLAAVEQRVEAGQGSAGLTQLLARMGVKYIVVRNDLIRSDLYGAWPARVNDAMRDSPGLVKVAQFGSRPVGNTAPNDAISNFDPPYPPVEIFRVEGAEPVATVVPTAGTMRVYGGPESLLTLADLGVLGNEPVLLNSDSPQLRAAINVITDSLRRIVRNFGELRIDYSQTLTAKQPAQTFDATPDFLAPAWHKFLTVARYSGIRNVTASSSGAGLSAFPGQSATGLMPFASIDGDLSSMWESASTTGPAGQWLRVDFLHPVNPGTIRVAFANQASIGPPVTRIAVQTAAGQLVQAVAPTTGYQTLAVPAGASSWLRIKIVSVTSEPYSLDLAQVGIGDIAIPGVTPGRSIVAPAVKLPAGASASVALAKAEPQPSGCMLTSQRWVCSPYLVKPTEEQYGFHQDFTLPQGQSSSLSGLAVVTGRRVIAKAAWPGKTQPRVTASSTYTGDPEDMASAAFDGDPATTWVSGASDSHPVLRIRWRGMRTLRSITVVRPKSATSLLRVLVTGSGGRLRGGVIGRSGLLTFSPPLRTRQLTLSFTPLVLPVQISEVRVPGVRPLTTTSSGVVRFGCGQGPVIKVNGKTVPTSATGTAADLLQGRPISYTACASVPVTAGLNSINETAADPHGFDVQSALLTPVGPAGLTASRASPAAPAKVIQWTDSSRIVSVSAAQASYLVVNENFNPGWQASIGGRRLQPVQLDGWKQGWLLPAGTSGRVTLSYQPDSAYRAFVFAGLGTLALVLLAAAVPLRRRKTRARRQPPAAALAAGSPADRPAVDDLATEPIAWVDLAAHQNSARHDDARHDGANHDGAHRASAYHDGPRHDSAHHAGTRHRGALRNRLTRAVRGRTARALVALAGLVAATGAGLWAGGYPGAVLVPAIALCFVPVLRYRGSSRTLRVFGSGWIVVAVLLAAAISQAVALVLQSHGAAGPAVTLVGNGGPQVGCLIIIGRLIAELARSYWVPASGTAAATVRRDDGDLR